MSVLTWIIVIIVLAAFVAFLVIVMTSTNSSPPPTPPPFTPVNATVDYPDEQAEIVQDDITPVEGTVPLGGIQQNVFDPDNNSRALVSAQVLIDQQRDPTNPLKILTSVKNTGSNYKPDETLAQEIFANIATEDVTITIQLTCFYPPDTTRPSFNQTGLGGSFKSYPPTEDIDGSQAKSFIPSSGRNIVFRNNNLDANIRDILFSRRDDGFDEVIYIITVFFPSFESVVNGTVVRAPLTYGGPLVTLDSQQYEDFVAKFISNGMIADLEAITEYTSTAPCT